MQDDYLREAGGFPRARKVRLRGAEIRIAVGLALAILSSLIPFMNFFLTPFFILGGLFLAWRHYYASETGEAEEV